MCLSQSVDVCSETLAEWTGLEPATPGVTGRYSNQLNYHSVFRAFASTEKRIIQNFSNLSRSFFFQLLNFFDWWVLRGSNSRPSPCKGGALPTELSTPTVKVLHDASLRAAELGLYTMPQAKPYRKHGIPCSPQPFLKRVRPGRLRGRAENLLLRRPSSRKVRHGPQAREPCPHCRPWRAFPLRRTQRLRRSRPLLQLQPFQLRPGEARAGGRAPVRSPHRWSSRG